MGIIKAVTGSVAGTLADQWKEYYSCDAMPNDLLMVRGQKVVSQASSNTKGSDDYISDGSVIAVADGQNAIVTDMGKIIYVCTRPGENIFERGGSGVKNFFREVWDRVGYGGDVHHLQRVYFINTKEIIGNFFFCKQPIAVRITDKNTGADIDCSVTCSGVYSFMITDPETFYKNVAGGMASECKRSRLINTTREEFLSSVCTAAAQLTADGLRPSELPECMEEMNEKLSEMMTDRLSRFGISICSVALDSLRLDSKDSLMLQNAQFTGMLRDPEMAAAYLVAAQAEAMRTSANNPSGAAIGLAGMAAVSAAAGETVKTLKKQSSGGWLCSCGNLNKSGTFCTECGKKRPDIFG